MKTFAMGILVLGVAAAGCQGGIAPMKGADGSGPNNHQIVSTDYLKPAESRTFDLEYVGKVVDIPAGTKKLRVWIPVPQDSTVQTIKNLSFSPVRRSSAPQESEGGTEPRIGTESKYGNKFAYWE